MKKNPSNRPRNGFDFSGHHRAIGRFREGNAAQEGPERQRQADTPGCPSGGQGNQQRGRREHLCRASAGNEVEDRAHRELCQGDRDAERERRLQEREPDGREHPGTVSDGPATMSKKIPATSWNIKMAVAVKPTGQFC